MARLRGRWSPPTRQRDPHMTSCGRIEVPVLVVGAGPSGLCASILLSLHGVESLTVERHPGTSIYPRADGINACIGDRATGLVREVRCKYRVAADGSQRRIRERLGLTRHWVGVLGH